MKVTELRKHNEPDTLVQPKADNGRNAIATFLLVHGAFHGPWCWDRLIPELQSLGHRVEAVDLVQANEATKNADAILDGWAEAIVSAARASVEKVVLVGHSRSGIVISQAAERIPERISRLVYCAAMLVRNGETMADTRARLGCDPGSAIELIRDPDGIHFRADAASVAEMIYNRAAPSDRKPMVARLRAEPRAGFLIAPRLTESRYGRVPRVYIECTDDRVFGIEMQRGMQSSQPCELVITLETDHAPYLSAPKELAEALDQVAIASM